MHAKDILKRAFLSHHEGEAAREAANIFYKEAANIYFVEAMKTRPIEAWDAQLKEILKGDSKRICHGELMENLTEEERKLILLMVKNYIVKYTCRRSQRRVDFDWGISRALTLLLPDPSKSLYERTFYGYGKSCSLPAQP